MGGLESTCRFGFLTLQGITLPALTLATRDYEIPLIPVTLGRFSPLSHALGASQLLTLDGVEFSEGTNVPSGPELLMTGRSGLRTLVENRQLLCRDGDLSAPYSSLTLEALLYSTNYRHETVCWSYAFTISSLLTLFTIIYKPIPQSLLFSKNSHSPDPQRTCHCHPDSLGAGNSSRSGRVTFSAPLGGMSKGIVASGLEVGSTVSNLISPQCPSVVIKKKSEPDSIIPRSTPDNLENRKEKQQKEEIFVKKGNIGNSRRRSTLFVTKNNSYQGNNPTTKHTEVVFFVLSFSPPSVFYNTQEVNVLLTRTPSGKILIHSLPGVPNTPTGSSMSADRYKSSQSCVSPLLFGPTSFQKFACAAPRSSVGTEVSSLRFAAAMDSEPKTSTQPGEVADALPGSGSGQDHQLPPKSTADKKNRRGEIDECWAKESAPQQDLDLEHHNVQATTSKEPPIPPPRSVSEGDLSRQSDNSHVCIHKGDTTTSISMSRHDTTTPGGICDSPSDHGPGSEETGSFKDPDEDEPGVVRDPENEGDQEIIKRRGTSGTSDLTKDIEQLRPDYSSPEQLVNDVEICPDKPPAVNQDKIRNDEVLNATEGASKNEEASKNKEASRNDSEEERTRVENERYERCMKEHDEFYKLEDERLAKLPDNSSNGSTFSCDTQSDADEGGRAGLDPDHSSLWVPQYIDGDANLSKSQKRRRRQKKKQDKLKKEDSLGKLLGGKQTKDDEEHISTYDYGNSRHRSSHSLDTSGVESGNLFQKKRKVVKDCPKEEEFAASLNSTIYGEDFSHDTTESHSVLRDGSEKEDDIEEDFEDVGDPEDVEVSNEDVEENMETTENKPAPDNDSSSNSTGAKRKRKRNKKLPPSQKMTKQDHPQPPEASGRETRSKALKSGAFVEESAKPPKDAEERKGEKEKHPEQSQSQIATRTEGQVVTFKRPTCTRQDLRKLVAKAVHKSKNRTSNNFTINSKIEHFKIITDSATIKKLPTIDENAPLIEMAIPEFIWPCTDKTIEEDNMVNVKSRGVIQFIILVQFCHASTETWDAPSIEKTRDFASYLTCQIAEHKLEFGAVLRWTNPWGNVAVMGLDSSDLDLLMKFRTFFSTLRYGHQLFNTFPKDAMTESLGISILLRSDLREFQEKHLAEALFTRNDLSGILETLQSETFTASDKTRAGVSKNGWRNVLLEGDDTFLKSLNKFTALHWFNIGPASVQIHGGDRRAETPAEIEAKNKRRRFNMPIGHSLTDQAKSSINKSFRADQEALQRNLIVPHAQSRSGASKAPPPRKKK